MDQRLNGHRGSNIGQGGLPSDGQNDQGQPCHNAFRAIQGRLGGRNHQDNQIKQLVCDWIAGMLLNIRYYLNLFLCADINFIYYFNTKASRKVYVILIVYALKEDGKPGFSIQTVREAAPFISLWILMIVFVEAM